MFISATFSKPAKDVEEKLGKAYVKIRIWKNPSPAAGRTNAYIQESFTDKQSFTKKYFKGAGGTIHSGTRRIHVQELCRTLGKRRDDLHG